MRPRVFLSHSKNDEDFIIRIADDLRIAQIDSWYDDWEIPPGASIRSKIFDEGLPNCDVFFVYLSDNSINSYWVSKELDAAITLQSENKTENIVLFCSSEEIRKKLPVDLRSCNIPVLTENDYTKPMLKLIAAIYKNYTNNTIKRIQSDQNKENLLLKNQILELQNTLLQRESGIDFEELKSKFMNTKITFNSITLDLLFVFEKTRNLFASGTNIYKLDKELIKLFDFSVVEKYHSSTTIISSFVFDEIIGPLVIYQILEIIPETDNTFKSYQLTKLGKDFLRSLE